MSIALNWLAGPSEMTIGEYTAYAEVGEGVSKVVMRHAGGANCYDFGNGFDLTDDGDIKNRWVFTNPDSVTGATVTTSATSAGSGAGLELNYQISGDPSAQSQYGVGVLRPCKKIYTEGDDYNFMYIVHKDQVEGATSSSQTMWFGLTETEKINRQEKRESGGTTITYQFELLMGIWNDGTNLKARCEFGTLSGNTSGVTQVVSPVTITPSDDYVVGKVIKSGTNYRSAFFEAETVAEAWTRAAAWTSGSASALDGYLTEGSITNTATVSFKYLGLGFTDDSDTATAESRKVTCYGIDGTVCNWYAPHYGNANDCGLWNVYEVPDTAAETKNGWTFVLDGGASSSGELKHDHAEFTIARENSDTKVFGYTHDTNLTVTQSSTSKYIFGKFQFDANNVNDAWRYGFFNSTTNDCANNGHSIGSDSTGHFFTCIGGTAGNTTTSTFTVDTDYWLRLEIDEGTSYLDVFNASATRSEVDAGRGNGDFASLSRDISSATITCDEVGLRNTNRIGANSSMTMRGYETEGNAHADHADGLHDGWYPDIEFDFNQQALGVSSAYTFSYSTFAVSSTGSNIMYSRRIDTTGDSSLDFTGGYLSESATAALDDEDGFEMAWKCNFDPTELSSAVTLAEITAEADELAPDVNYLFVRKNTTLASYAVECQMADNVAMKFGEVRYSPDGGTTLYIVDWNDTTKKRVGTAFASYTVTNSYKIANEGDTQAVLTPAGQYDEILSLKLANLGLSANATILIQVRATDAADNQSGWVTATEYGTNITEAIANANEMELLRIIATQTA